MFKEIEKKLQEVKKEYPHKGGISLYFLLIIRLMEFAWRVVSARIYLRKCTHIAKWVTTNGKPFITAKGKIIIEERVAIWSVFERTKLLVQRNGVLRIGKNSRINGVHIAVENSVVIGRNVRIAPYTLILDSDFHDVNDHYAEGLKGSIEIGDNVWIASRATILKGVKIGEGAVIAAGSVVTRDVPAFTIAAGVPAKVIRHLKGNSAISKEIKIDSVEF